MNKEEIEELKDFTIDITDIDELALGLEVCSKKSNMVIQEFANLIIELQKDNKQLKDNWNKLKEYVDTYLTTTTMHLYTLNAYKNIQDKIQELEKSDKCE